MSIHRKKDVGYPSFVLPYTEKKGYKTTLHKRGQPYPCGYRKGPSR